MTDNNEKNNWPVWATEPVEIKDYNPNWKEKGLTLKKELYQIRRKTPCFSHGDIRHFALHPFRDVKSKFLNSLYKTC